MKNEIFKEVVDCYTMSNQTKGLPSLNIKNFNKVEDLIELVKENKIQIIQIGDVINPFVKNYNINKSKEEQVRDLKENLNECIIYPSEKVVIELRPDKENPYSHKIREGSGGNDLTYFEQEALRKYIESQNYLFINNGFNYYITTSDEALEKGAEFIQIRCCAPSRETNGEERAIGITLIELSNLPSKEQMYWHSFEFEDQEKWTVNKGFKKAYLIGERLDEVWIYDDILSKMSLINEFCLNLEHPPLFKKEFEGNSPTDFIPILSPTNKNLNQFLLIFNNMLPENLNKKFFKQCKLTNEPLSLKRGDGSQKGTIQLLEDFLYSIYPHEKDMIKRIINPIFELRNKRNPSAHKIQETKTDLDFYQQQEDIVYYIWDSLCNLTMALGNQPENRKQFFEEQFYPVTFY